MAKKNAGNSNQSGKISMHPLTPEQALEAALNTAMPDSKVRQTKKPAKNKGGKK